MPSRNRLASVARLFMAVAMLALIGSISACSTLGYYHQAIRGHWEVMRKRVPVADMLAANDTPLELKRKLEIVSAARTFAAQHLGLPDNASYRSYVDLGRPYIVWNVFATPSLSLQPIESCFIFVGCLSYRGFFDPAEAQAYADSLSTSGHDVFIGGVAAYSTLGWFDDPVLNTMLRWADHRYVKVIFHELAHQRLYVPDDTMFNESFATLVAEIGLERWLEAHGSPVDRYRHSARREQQFYALLLAHRDRLQKVYASDLSEAAKRTQKTAIFQQLRQRYADLKRSWDGDDAYDNWMSNNLNNAKLASIATYYDYVPIFRSILEGVGGDLEQFYAVAKRLSKLPRAQRQQCLESRASQVASPPTSCDEMLSIAP